MRKLSLLLITILAINSYSGFGKVSGGGGFKATTRHELEDKHIKVLADDITA